MKRVLSIQDLSCVGQCSLTVALPIVSAFGIETAVLPTAILSTHTSGFKNFTCLDLTSELTKISDHWKSQNLTFDGIYTGYMASKEQIDIVINIIKEHRQNGQLLLVDPAMADDGKLYPAFSNDFPLYMKKLVEISDICCPNITEACFVLGKEYKESFSKEEIIDLVLGLKDLGCKEVVLTGVSLQEGYLGAAYYTNGEVRFYQTEFINIHFHGTGDIFASALFGALMKENTLDEAVKIACDYTVSCIKSTMPDKETHKYGVHFEEHLNTLKKD